MAQNVSRQPHHAHDFIAACRATHDLNLPPFHTQPLGNDLHHGLVRPPVLGRGGDVNFQAAVGLALDGVASGARCDADLDGRRALRVLR